MSEQLPTPTSASAFIKARNEGVVIPLPSGFYARIRPIALDVLVANGEIPDLLSNMASTVLWKETEVEDLLDASVKNGQQLTQLINHLMPAAFVEPKVVSIRKEVVDDNTICVEDLDFGDKILVFQLSIQPVEVLRKFRDKQNTDVDPVHDDEDNTSDTESSAGNRRPMDSLPI